MSARKKAKCEKTMTDKTVGNAWSEQQHWFPLENTPCVMNFLLAEMGFDTSLYKFTDILSIEPGEIKMIPQPAIAVMMFHPFTDGKEEYDENKDVINMPDNVWFIQDRIKYACGTIGLLHALLNAPEPVRTVAIRPYSWLHSFYQACPVAMSPAAKAERFEGDSMIKKLHNKAASNLEESMVAVSPSTKAEQLEGNCTIKMLPYKAASEECNETSHRTLGDEISGHFTTMVHINGGLYMLDGHKHGPVRHGDTTQETLLEDACKVVEKFMKCDSDKWGFTIMALVPKKKL